MTRAVYRRVAHTSRQFLSGCMRPNSAYNHPVSMQKHYYGLNHLHCFTKSTYRRARLYDSERFRNQ
jgi:hypothetical protein